jgi:hypothetical protein
MTFYIALVQNIVPTTKLLPHKNAIKIVPNRRHFVRRKYQTRIGAKPNVAHANISFRLPDQFQSTMLHEIITEWWASKMTRQVSYDEAVDSLEYAMANDSNGEYWTGQDIEAEVLQCEGLLEHLATGTADNHEQPLPGHRQWSSVLEHRVISHTVTDVSTRKITRNENNA